MSAQQQELGVYRDHTITQVSRKSLSLITHVEGTAPTWLVCGLVEDYLLGTCSLINNTDTSDKQTYSLEGARSNVLFASFMHDMLPFEKFLKKRNIVPGSHFKFVNLMEQVYENEDAVLKKLQQELTSFEDLGKPLTVILDSPEYLVHSTEIKIVKLLSFLQMLQKKGTNLVVVASVDGSLVDFHSSQPEEIEFRHTEFVTKLLHKSNVIFNLKPLETGRADDITGILTITKGPIDNLDVLDREYLYLINKEGNVKLFFR